MLYVCNITIKNKDYACYFTHKDHQSLLDTSQSQLLNPNTNDGNEIYTGLIAAINEKNNVLLNSLPLATFRAWVEGNQVFFQCRVIEKYYRVSDEPEETKKNKPLTDPELKRQVLANHFLFNRFSAGFIQPSSWRYLANLMSLESLRERHEIRERLKEGKFYFKIYNANNKNRPHDSLPLIPTNQNTQLFLNEKVALTMNRDEMAESALLVATASFFGVALSMFPFRGLIPVAAANRVPPQPNYFSGNQTLVPRGPALNPQIPANLLLDRIPPSNTLPLAQPAMIFTPNTPDTQTQTPFTEFQEKLMMDATRYTIGIDQRTLQCLNRKKPLQVQASDITAPLRKGYKIILSPNAIDYIISVLDDDNKAAFNTKFYKTSDFLALSYVSSSDAMEVMLLAARTEHSGKQLSLSEPPPEEIAVIIKLQHTYPLIERYSLAFISQDNTITTSYPYQVQHDVNFYSEDPFTEDLFKNKNDAANQHASAKAAYQRGARDEKTLTILFFTTPKIADALMLKNFYIDFTNFFKINPKTPEGMYARGIICYTVGTHRYAEKYLEYAKKYLESAENTFAYAYAIRYSASVAKEQILERLLSNPYQKMIDDLNDNYPMLFQKHPLRLSPLSKRNLEKNSRGYLSTFHTINRLPAGTLIVTDTLSSELTSKGGSRISFYLIVKNFDVQKDEPLLIPIDACLDGDRLVLKPISHPKPVIMSRLPSVIVYRALINLNGERQPVNSGELNEFGVQVVTSQIEPYLNASALNASSLKEQLSKIYSITNLEKINQLRQKLIIFCSYERYSLVYVELSDMLLELTHLYNQGLQNEAMFDCLVLLATIKSPALLDSVQPYLLDLYFEPGDKGDDYYIQARYFLFRYEALKDNRDIEQVIEALLKAKDRHPTWSAHNIDRMLKVFDDNEKSLLSDVYSLLSTLWKRVINLGVSAENPNNAKEDDKKSEKPNSQKAPAALQPPPQTERPSEAYSMFGTFKASSGKPENKPEEEKKETNSVPRCLVVLSEEHKEIEHHGQSSMQQKKL